MRYRFISRGHTKRTKSYSKEIKEEIENLRKNNSIIVVEGKKDKTSFIRLGFKGDNIFVINRTGVSFYALVEELVQKARERKCAILMDLDKKGKHLYQIIKEKLLSEGIKTDSRIRNLLIKEGVSHIEGLYTFLENIKIMAK